MKTMWGRNIDPEHVLPEYPRPQMRRESCLNLNGIWEYAFTDDESMPGSFDGEILVPFSPESELSGVNRSLPPDRVLWYRRDIMIPSGFRTGRVLLHFGAVDQEAVVFLNGREVCRHTGGYTPFSADVTGYLGETNTIVVRVKDYSDTRSHSRGKQKRKKGGIWYTPQSGIWQTVWMERVPDEYIRSLRITPLFDQGAVEIVVNSEGSHPCTAFVEGSEVSFVSDEPVVILLKEVIPWAPEHPHLYDLTVTMGEDRVDSYFGMRKFSMDVDAGGIRRLFLNNRPYFHNGLLDQGYYCDGMLTPPSDEAMIFDIQTAREMGFNMLRKHIKIEPPRWYYHCDRLGILVWQDMINGGGSYNTFTITSPLVTGVHFKDHRYGLFARREAEGREQYYRELDEMTDHLYNVVSLALWVPFNEGWGQFDAGEAVRRILKKDTTRTIDHASGWHDQYIGDVKSLHVYFRKYRFRKDRLNRAVILSEFGGYTLGIPGHRWSDRTFGYKRFNSPGALLKAYRELYEKEITPAKERGLCAAVYTQFTDVEDELNGLVTYDREVIKIPPEVLREINAPLRDPGSG